MLITENFLPASYIRFDWPCKITGIQHHGCNKLCRFRNNLPHWDQPPTGSFHFYDVCRLRIAACAPRTNSMTRHRAATMVRCNVKPHTRRRCTQASLPRSNPGYPECTEGARRETTMESSDTPCVWRRYRYTPGVSARRQPRFRLPEPLPKASDPPSCQSPATSRAVRCVLLAAHSPSSSDCSVRRFSF